MTVTSALDVVIVGGGPAGLSAALLLGRARRRVVVVDQGCTRNARSVAMHGYLSRDGEHPAVFRQQALQNVSAYPTVTLITGQAIAAVHDGAGFAVTLADGTVHLGRKLLLATGVVDQLPDIAGIEAFYGTSVHHCPYCDGYEYRDAPIVVVGPSAKCSGMARMMLRWSEDVSFAPEDPAELCERDLHDLARTGVKVVRQPVVGLVGAEGRLSDVVLADGRSLACKALFFNTGQHQHSSLIARLGVGFTDKGGAVAGRLAQTDVDGVYVAGDATRDVQFVIVAAAEGAMAAVAIDKALMIEDGLLAE